MEKKELKIMLLLGKNLAPMDDSIVKKNSCDPYVVFNFGEQIVRSATKNDTLNPGKVVSSNRVEFYQCLYLPIAEPVFVSQLTIEVKDKDITFDESLGSIRLRISEIKASKFSKLFWAHIYGAPIDGGNLLGLGRKTEVMKHMNSYPQSASCYKGSLLMSLEMSSSSAPRFTVEDISKDQVKELMKDYMSISKRHTLVLDISSLFGMVTDSNKRCTVEVSCGNEKRRSREHILNNSSIVHINQRLFLTYDVQYSNAPHSVPDVFVYVLINNVPSLFLRFNIRTFDTGADYAIYPLLIDRSIDSKMLDHEAGYIRCRYGIFSNGIPVDWIEPNSNPTASKVSIVANIMRGIELPSADDDGMADPFVELDHAGNKQITNVCDNTLDPSWNQRIVLDSFVFDGAVLPIIVTVHDADSDDPQSNSEFMGKVVVPMNSSLLGMEMVNIVPPAQWYNLEYSSKIKMGKLLMSFQLFPYNPNLKQLIAPLASRKNKYCLKMQLLGLRNFESHSIFPIKKPYLRINLAALKGEKSDGTDLDYVTANSKKGNSSCNFSEIIK